jgi:hypothetical protein
MSARGMTFHRQPVAASLRANAKLEAEAGPR